jgi:TerC family integral membrane protein
MSSLVVPVWAWALLASLLVLFLILDLVAHRGDQVDSRRRAVIWSIVWIGAALGFNAFVAVRFGADAGEQWLAAYLLEKSLSIDNLFLFLVVFGALGIPRTEQRRVLTWGIIGALVTRAVFMFAGVAALQRWHEITYVFGALLVVTAVRLLVASESHDRPRVLGWLERHLPWTPRLAGHHFVARIDGRLVATPLLIALVAIESADIVFALDSIPAAFAVSQEPFILYSSNVFAVLGLRALFVVLADLLAGLRYLKYGLVAVLGFAGAKLLVAPWLHVPPLLSVGVIAAAIAVAVVASTRSSSRLVARIRRLARSRR